VSQKGAENVRLEELVQQAGPQGLGNPFLLFFSFFCFLIISSLDTATVPTHVKVEMLHLIKDFLQQHY